MKKYFKRLWQALINKQTPSGLKPNTWYECHEFNKPENGRLAIVTDDLGHIVPFVKHESGWRF